ncbi:hypothetical protein ACIGEZ_11725 [Streptomyces sp. NPDC085481]|uniref:hypothetical protein n=1 Tax=Streptomyces sp. NPDC085481 TaxID=3365727 RepID=UPI0037D9286E
MKPTKVAAVIAGSVMALGVAAPAMAAEMPTSLDGGLGSLTSQGLKSEALSSTTDGSPVQTVTDTAGQLNQAGKGASGLLGGLPIGG